MQLYSAHISPWPKIRRPYRGLARIHRRIQRRYCNCRPKLDKKVTKRYDLQGRPFAIVVSNHDFACDSGDIQQAVCGDGGFFLPQADGSIRDTRVSAIYVPHRWAPWHQGPAQIFELLNPYPQKPLVREHLSRLRPPIAPSTALSIQSAS